MAPSSNVPSFTVSNIDVIGNNVFLPLILNSMEWTFLSNVCWWTEWILNEWYNFHVFMTYDLQHCRPSRPVQRHKIFKSFSYCLTPLDMITGEGLLPYLNQSVICWMLNFSFIFKLLLFMATEKLKSRLRNMWVGCPQVRIWCAFS